MCWKAPSRRAFPSLQYKRDCATSFNRPLPTVSPLWDLKVNKKREAICLVRAASLSGEATGLCRPILLIDREPVPGAAIGASKVAAEKPIADATLLNQAVGRMPGAAAHADIGP